jgi:hypothetical protein
MLDSTHGLVVTLPENDVALIVGRHLVPTGRASDETCSDARSSEPRSRRDSRLRIRCGGVGDRPQRQRVHTAAFRGRRRVAVARERHTAANCRSRRTSGRAPTRSKCQHDPRAARRAEAADTGSAPAPGRRDPRRERLGLFRKRPIPLRSRSSMQHNRMIKPALWLEVGPGGPRVPP